jgi:hypothetical protein
MPFDQTYNEEREFETCMEHVDEIMDLRIYIRLALVLEEELTSDLFPNFDPLQTIGKY